jgi:hypothetical protein
MGISALTLAVLFSLFQQLLWGQYGVGVQGSTFYSTGAWEARQELDEKRGWTAGVQWVEGGRKTTGFRIALDGGQRTYNLKSRNEEGMREEFASVSNFVWLSFELRWRLGRRHRFFFELGPVIGAEVREVRDGARFEEGVALGSGWYSRRIPVNEVETGFAIRDGRWRLGFSGEWPIMDRWLISTGLHLCPGVGIWARGQGYATVDASLRAGLLYVLGDGKTRGRRI